MYRHSAQISTTANNINRTALPASPDITSDDSEKDIVQALDRKRRQLDDEIAKFQAAKDKEFVDFERDLRAKKQKRRKDTTSSPLKPNSNSAAANALSLLAATTKKAVMANGHTDKKTKSFNGADSQVATQKIRPVPLLSKPTLSLDKQNIKGETTPPLATAGTPPTSGSLAKSISHSPKDTSGMSLSPPKTRNVMPPTPTTERPDNFAGVFAPAYLPLLESRSNSQSSTVQVPNPPRGSVDSHANGHSLNSSSLSPSIRVQRALTAPVVLPSTSLPSALRTASGTTVRRQKRVTFQLADRAIVEPSSSYEEGPSPDVGVERAMAKGGGILGIGEVLSVNGPSDDVDGHHADDAKMARGGIGDGIVGEGLLVEDDSEYGHPLDDDDEDVENDDDSESDPDAEISTPTKRIYGSAFGQRPLRSPTIKGREQSLNSDDADGTVNGSTATNVAGLELQITPAAEAEDGGSGVGFFELDEELASPGSGARPSTFDLDEGEDSAPGGGRFSHTKDDEYDGYHEDEDDEGMLKSRKTKTYEYSGSVPIDIVRPSGSWIGSFGH